MTERGDITVSDLDGLPARDAEPLFAACCGSGAWTRRMVERRPFGDVTTLVRAADEVWWSLGPEDWREAFAHHPRIGEREAAVAQDSRARAWSGGEQRGVANAADDIRAALAEGNREYERRFGHIYLVSAAGKSVEELLALLRARLSNDADTELRVAAGEQAKITRLRLLKLVGASDGAAASRSPLSPPPSSFAR